MKASEFFQSWDAVHVRMFKELARRVGKTLDDIEVENYEWPYADYQWTKEEEEDFRKWLVDYAYKRRSKLGLRHATKKYIRTKEVPDFMLMYSWKYKEDK